MATQVELAKLFYTVEARLAGETSALLAKEASQLDAVGKAASGAGIYTGQLKAAMLQLGAQLSNSAQGTQTFSARLAQSKELLEQTATATTEASAAHAAAGKAAEASSTAALRAARGADSLGKKFSNAAFGIASAAEEIARTGEAGEGAVKSLLKTGTNAAFFFGAEGAFVGAIGVAVLAVVGLFNRSREEMKKLTEETRKEIADLQVSGDPNETARRINLTTLGDPRAALGSAEEKGIARTKQDLRDLRAALDRLFNHETGRLIDPADNQRALDLTDQIEKLDHALVPLIAKRDKLTGLLVQQGGKRATEDLYGLRADAAKRAATEAQRVAAADQLQRDAVRDIAEAYTDLFAKAAAGKVEMDDFDHSVRELGESFAKIVKPTSEQSALIGTLQDRVAGARDTLKSVKTDEAQAQLRKFYAALSPSTLDDFAIAIEEARKQLGTSGLIPPEAVNSAIAYMQALHNAAETTKRVESDIAAIGNSSLPPLRKASALMKERAELELQLNLLTAAGSKDEAHILSLKTSIAKVDEALVALGQAQGEQAASHVTTASDLADAYASVATAVLSIFDALGAVDSRTRSLAQGLIGIGKGVGDLFTPGKQAQGAIGIAGGAAELLKGISAGQSEQNRQAAQHHAEALARLEAIKKHTADLVGLSSSGLRISTLTKVLEGLLARPISGSTRGMVAQLVTSAPSTLASLTGIPRGDLEALAKSFGVTLDGTRQSLIDFLAALKEADFHAFADSFAGALEELNAEFSLFPERFQTNAEKFTAIVELLNDETKGAPALFETLKGLNVGTAEGADAAKEAIAALFERAKQGKLTAAELNGLSIEQFLQALKDLKEKMEGALAPAKTAAEQFSGALDIIAIKAEFGLLNAKERLAASIAEFMKAFPETAKTIDFSSATAFKKSIESVIAGFAADGELSDAEKAQVDALRALLDAFTAATPAATTFTDALQVLQDQFEIFGLDASQRFTFLAKQLGDALPSIKDLLAGLDVGTADGRAELQKRAQSLFAKLAEGGVTEEERAIVDALKRILGATGDIANAEANQAAELAAKIRSALSEINFALDLQGITDPLERFKAMVDALAKVSPDIADAIKGFDLSTQEGRDHAIAELVKLAMASTDDAARESIKQLVDTLRGIKPPDATPPSELGLPNDAQSKIDSALQSISVAQIGYNPQFAHLLDLTVITNSLLSAILATQRLSAGVTAPFIPPSSFIAAPLAPSNPGGTSRANAVTQHFYASVNFMGPVGGDVNAVAAAAHEGMKKAIDQALGRDASFKRQLKGRSELA